MESSANSTAPPAISFKQLCGKTLVSIQYLNCDNALLAEYQSKSASG